MQLPEKSLSTVIDKINKKPEAEQVSLSKEEEADLDIIC